MGFHRAPGSFKITAVECFENCVMLTARHTKIRKTPLWQVPKPRHAFVNWIEQILQKRVPAPVRNQHMKRRVSDHELLAIVVELGPLELGVEFVELCKIGLRRLKSAMSSTEGLDKYPDIKREDHIIQRIGADDEPLTMDDFNQPFSVQSLQGLSHRCAA